MKLTLQALFREFPVFTAIEEPLEQTTCPGGKLLHTSKLTNQTHEGLMDKEYILSVAL